MADFDLFAVGDRGEVELLVPRQQLVGVEVERRHLGCAQVEAHLGRAGHESLHGVIISHHFALDLPRVAIHGHRLPRPRRQDGIGRADDGWDTQAARDDQAR